jgi:hypothetical protein
MVKQSGIGSALWWGTVDLSGDIGSISAADTSRGVLDVTGLDLSAPERILGRRDGSLAFTSFWNKTGAHASLSTLPATDVQVTVAHGTPALGSVAASIIAIETTYGTQAGADGSLAATISASADGYPLEWGRLLTTGKQTFASGTINGASIDAADEDTAFDTDTEFGCAAYLHVFSLGSGDPIVTVTDSAANSVFLTLAPTPIVFTPTAAGTERKQTGLTAVVRRYVRVTVSGTYTDLVCALVFVRYTESAA